ncbi:UDP-N-acetylmuramate--L-alanine ligase [Collibacillus ludicampi]|jgi:UDP-N-acetylmuramate--alanine ligase|uniref:UDP-N-acetylmuramate--L-alanine ligase n=1 Tax=Collibacillus ludicampi TaxID=2771369 RepID=A0AAV4LAN8_9BACL|nr:UDP-N-acetylmuramate--L-alanine ligase [Collibacillus ludicampi]GIM44856.1 UDP-N-acetylmuramate--L-alanine ligase [Collibacillus ludicampi]
MRIHFTGIKGSGMSSLAQLYKHKGHHVTGSDVEETFFTDQLLKRAGIEVLPFDEENVRGVDLVCSSAAYNMTHPELSKAKELGIPIYSYPRLLGELTKEYESILITGTHGKTTTTGLVGSLFMEAGLDPSIVVGSYIESLKNNTRAGKGSHLILEACEYRRHFHHYKGRVMVVTNIDYDHPDYFKDIEDTFDAFQHLANTLPSDGALIVCGDNLAKQLVSPARKITFGFDKSNDVYAEKIEPGRFHVYAFGRHLGEMRMSLLGDHNVLNALAMVSVGLFYNVNAEVMRSTLLSYCGVKRRLEFKGELNRNLIYDDYAHHPTEIRVTLRAVKENFPEAEVVTIFQPHTYTRTKSLLREFAQSFQSADRVILTDIFASEREKDQVMDIGELVEETKKHHPRVTYIPKTQLTSWICEEAKKKEPHVFLTMGAGDIYKEGEKVLQSRLLYMGS